MARLRLWKTLNRLRKLDRTNSDVVNRNFDAIHRWANAPEELICLRLIGEKTNVFAGIERNASTGFWDLVVFREVSKPTDDFGTNGAELIEQGRIRVTNTPA